MAVAAEVVGTAAVVAGVALGAAEVDSVPAITAGSLDTSSASAHDARVALLDSTLLSLTQKTGGTLDWVGVLMFGLLWQ